MSYKMTMICLLWILTLTSCYTKSQLAKPLHEVYNDKQPIVNGFKLVQISAETELIAEVLQQCRNVRPYNTIQVMTDYKINFVSFLKPLTKVELTYSKLQTEDCNKIYEMLRQLSPSIQIDIRVL
jgi:hypothetical protein